MKNDEVKTTQKQENIIIYDWVSFTTKIHSLSQVIEMLGMEKISFDEIYGFHGYQSRKYFEGVSIHFNGQENMGIWVEMSGQGCRAFETYGNGDYDYLFDMILSEPKDMKITRLDIAYDDHNGIFDIKKLKKESEAENFISKFDGGAIYQPIKKDTGITIEHGSKASNIFIRIYDKAKEKALTDGSHWIRFEIQLRDENADSFIRLLDSIGNKFLGVVNNYLRYVKPTGNDSNKRRWETALYWKKFIGSAEKIKLYQKPGVEYNERKLHSYVVGQAGNSINTYREIFGDVGLISSLDEHKKTAVLSDKQKRLLAKYKNK